MPKTITLKIPDSLMEEYGNDPEQVERAALEDFVAEEYRKSTITIRQGAKMLGLTYVEFMQFLGKRKIGIIQASEEELAKEYEGFKKFMESHGK